mmetsp:Transcript_12043/g.25340  ORF Transcript_12043/g.25340 Transcript_12043/m.25340 type:complete len:109 (+) Transcript_12043:96-422(+)
MMVFSSSCKLQATSAPIIFISDKQIYYGDKFKDNIHCQQNRLSLQRSTVSNGFAPNEQLGECLKDSSAMRAFSLSFAISMYLASSDLKFVSACCCCIFSSLCFFSCSK